MFYNKYLMDYLKASFPHNEEAGSYQKGMLYRSINETQHELPRRCRKSKTALELRPSPLLDNA